MDMKILLAAAALTAILATVPKSVAAQARANVALRAMTEDLDWEPMRLLLTSGTLSQGERDELAERVADIMVADRGLDPACLSSPSSCVRGLARITLRGLARGGSVGPLIRVYEAYEADRWCGPITTWGGKELGVNGCASLRTVNERNGVRRFPDKPPGALVGIRHTISLWDIAEWGGDRGLEYVRRVFRTSERPPPEAATEVTDYERYSLLRTPWCRSGKVLFGDELKRAYDRPADDITVPPYIRPPSPPGALSADASAWWDLCWDGRNWQH